MEVDGDRYVVPGDFARLEEDGTITLLGRGNTCVNTSGEKVFGDEVEEALKSHPKVFDALVVAVPDDRLGQRVAALVQARPGAAVDITALDAHVRRRLAGYKAPRSMWFVAEVGRLTSAKPDYRWATEHIERHEPAWHAATEAQPRASAGGRMRTSLGDMFGVEHPIFGFSPSEHVAAAIRRAGGLGVLGCVRFNDPAELDATPRPTCPR